MIGLEEGEAAPSTLGSFSASGNVEVDVINGGFVGAFAVAGSKSSGSASQSQNGSGGTSNPGTGGTQGSNGTQQSNQDLATWQSKMGAVLQEAVAKGKMTGNIAGTANSEGGGTAGGVEAGRRCIRLGRGQPPFRQCGRVRPRYGRLSDVQRRQSYH